MNHFRIRLTFWYVGVLAATLLLFSAVLYFSLRARLWKNLDPALLAMAQTEVASAIDDTREGMHLHEIDADWMTASSFHRLAKYVQIIDPEGHVFVRTRNLGDHILPIIEADLLSERNVDFRTVTLPDYGQLRMVSLVFMPDSDTRTWVMQLATSTREIEVILHRFLWLLASLATGTLVLTCFGGVFLADRALKPIARMTDTAREITEHNLNLRLSIETDDEIGRLARVLNDMLDRLQQAFEALRRFTANASHEIRSPLTALKGDIEVTLRRLRTPEDYRQVLTRSLEEVDRLSRLTTDLLLLARADSGRLSLSQVYLPVSKLFDQVRAQQENRCLQKRVALETSVDEDVAIWGDADALTRVMFNLVDNSLHHVPPGGEIALAAQKHDDLALLTVTDSGCGIDLVDQPHIFERFYRASSARSGHYEGSGLGLAICKEIVEAHRGRISVVSPADGESGARIIIYLPIAD